MHHHELFVSEKFGILLDGNHRRETFERVLHLFVWPAFILPPLPRHVATMISFMEVTFYLFKLFN